MEAFDLDGKEIEISPTVQRQVIKPMDFTQEQVDLIKRMHSAANLTDDEFMAFMHFCRRKRVDPLLKQAYATKRRMKDGTSVVAIMTSIEGLRAIADRTQDYCPGTEPEFIVDEKNKLTAAKVSVKKFVQNGWHEFKGVAYFSEFNQGNFMWEKMPRNQLAKCAEAQALRKGWPEDCGGFYVPEEFPEIQANGADKPTKEKGILTKLKKSETDNRGHGAEGVAEAVNSADLKPEMIFTGDVQTALFHDKAGKQYIELKFDTEITGAIHTIALTCWHKSLFQALLRKPKHAQLVVKGYGGHKGWPSVEDVLSVDGVKYEKGVPIESISAPAPISVPEIKEPIAAQSVKNVDHAVRNESLLELSNLFEKLWPAANIDKRALRNRIGQSLFKLQRKEQLMDLQYPQATIDAAVIALRKFLNMAKKPTTDSGIENEIFNTFNEELAELKSRESGELFA